MLSDPFFLAMAIPAVAIMGISKGGFAGGLGLVGVPLIALAVDPRTAAALTLPILIMMDAVVVWVYRGRWHLGHLKVLLMGALAGIALGALTFEYVSEGVMRLIVGATGLLFFASRWVLRAKVSAVEAPVDAVRGGFWGALSGFTSFTAHAGGPPVAMYLLPRNIDKTSYQATTTAFFAVVNLVKVPPYLWLGQFNREVLLTALVLLPLAALSARLGGYLHTRVDDKWFYRICNGMLIVTCCKLLWDGARSLGG